MIGTHVFSERRSDEEILQKTFKMSSAIERRAFAFDADMLRGFFGQSVVQVQNQEISDRIHSVLTQTSSPPKYRYRLTLRRRVAIKGAPQEIMSLYSDLLIEHDTQIHQKAKEQIRNKMEQLTKGFIVNESVSIDFYTIRVR